MFATENVVAKREPWFVEFIILFDNAEFCWNAALRSLLRMKEETFEDACCNKAAFVLYDLVLNIVSYCLT